MKKIILTLSLIFVLVFPLVSAGADIAYILKDTGNSDPNIISAINELGLSYELIDDSHVSSTNFDNYGMILIGNENFGTTISLQIPVNEKNTMFLTHNHLDEWHWAGRFSYVTSNRILEARKINLNSSIVKNFPEIFPVYTSCCYSPGGLGLPMYHLSMKASGVKNLVSTTSSSSEGVIAVAEPGSLLRDFQISDARGLFFGIIETGYWNENSRNLFKNSVEWVLYGEDRDGDGIFDDEDNCISIANLDQLDTDSDGLGDLCDVCVLDIENDADEDGVCEIDDNCPQIANEDQEDFDLDDLGDACDDDVDDDGVENDDDLCEKTRSGEVADLNGCAPYQLIVINEFESNPASGEEWVEIYNPTDTNVYISGWKIYDNLVSSQLRYTVPEFSVIESNDYYVAEIAGLNNDGDFIILYDNADLEIDKTPVLSDVLKDDNSWNRIPNGFDNDSEDNWVFQISTRGFSNNLDLVPPVVTLLSPEHGELINVDHIEFNYSVQDDFALNLECKFYSDLDGEFEELFNQRVSNNGIGSFVATDVEDGEYIWNVECSDGRNSVFASENRSFRAEINEAPILDFIDDKAIRETETVVIIANATDAEGDDLEYSIAEHNDSDFIQDDGKFEWQTDYSDAGEYLVTISVTDGNSTVSQDVKITVSNNNRVPVLIKDIATQNWDEDNTIQIDLEDYFSDPDDEDLIYSVLGNENILVEFSDSLATLSTLKDWNGVELVTFKAFDGYDETSSNEVHLIVNPVNDAPVINSVFPEFDPIYKQEEFKLFIIDFNDVDNLAENLTIKWILDGEEIKGNITGGLNLIEILDLGLHTLEFSVSDLQDSVSHSWNVLITNIPIANNYNGATTDFTGMDETDLMNINLTLEKTEFGKIEFLDLVDLRDKVDFDHYSDIQQNLVGIDTDYFTSLQNKQAKVTLYGIEFNEDPTIYYNKEFTLNTGEIDAICPSSICSDVNYDSANNILSFLTNSFSTFFIKSSLTCSEQQGDNCNSDETCNGEWLNAVDSDKCCSIQCIEKPRDFKDIDSCESITEDLEITIKEPDDGDDFEIKGTINAEVKIKNNAEEDLDVDIEVFLYDLTEEDVLEKVDEGIDIDEGESETLEFELDIPSDADEDNDYIIFVKAEAENDLEYCNEEDIDIELERKKHDIVIKSFDIDPQVVDCEGEVDVSVKVENLGTEDDDSVYVTVENQDLNINKQSQTFELEKYGDNDNDRSVRFSLDIPQDAEEKDHELKITVHFDNGGEYSEIGNIIVDKCEKKKSDRVLKLNPIQNKESETISLQPIYRSKAPEIKTVSKSRSIGVDIDLEDKQNLIVIDLLLAIGIVLILIGIVFVQRRIY